MDSYKKEGGLGGWVKKVKGLSTKKPLVDTENSTESTRGKGGGEGRRGKERVNGDGRRIHLGW